MPLNSIRETINIFLYDSKNITLKIFKYLNILVSFGAFCTIIYYYGFPLLPDEQSFCLAIVKGSFAYYVFHYIVKFIYDFHPKEFLKKTWFEGVIMFLLITEAISYNFFDHLLIASLFQKLGVVSFTDFSNVFIQIYFFIVVIVEITRTTSIFPTVKLHPSNVFMITFFILILGGTGLLMLPEMTTIQGGMNFLDAIFTSTSATCVTGLIVEDTATFFTFKGHLVLAVLIKLGGLNIIAFGTFMALFSRLGLGVKHHEVIEDFVNRDSMLSSRGMFGKIVFISLFIELVGTCLIFSLWDDSVPFNSFGEKAFYSFFHSISAFNNAGFSTFTDGLNNPLIQGGYLLHIVIGVLIIFGSIGFTTLLDVFSRERLRLRLQQPWRDWAIGTKISVYTTTFLLALGTIAFFTIERTEAFDSLNTFQSIVTAFFTSVTTRTAGFNTIDLNTLSYASLVMVIFLMFIGASSSSTGGGIKTSSFFIIVASSLATIKNKKQIEFSKRTIPVDLVHKALSIFVFSFGGITIFTFLLSISEMAALKAGTMTIMDIFFEEVSAFSTVGLSLGITSSLSPFGKILVMVSMFIGRIGTLTLAFALSKSAISKNYKYPSGHLMVG